MNYETRSRNPLKSGQCFLPYPSLLPEERLNAYSRNPLKSGQCFLPCQWCGKSSKLSDCVAIPSNRVNVSYPILEPTQKIYEGKRSRNPLKSGQCFLPGLFLCLNQPVTPRRNPLKSGQCFLLAGVYPK